MSDNSHQEGHQEAHRTDGADRDIDSQIDSEPPRPTPLPNQGLRKRTSILVGLAFVLFGLLMLFIAGDSAAVTESGWLFCDSPFSNDTGEIH